MATYQSTNVSSKKPIGGHGLAKTMKVAYFEVAPTAALTTSDALQFGYLPQNARVVYAYLEATDLDTDASPTLTLNIGDSGDADRLFAASTVGQAGTASGAIAVAGLGYKYTSDTLITGVPAANAATGAAGTIYLIIGYVIED